MKSYKQILFLFVLQIPFYLFSQNFTPQTPAFQTGNEIMKSICAVDSNIAYIAGYSYSYNRNFTQKTIDGGQNWFIIDSSYNFMDYSVDFYDADTGYVSGVNVKKTTDGGNTWQTLTVPQINSSPPYANIYIQNAKKIWILSGENKFIKTTDYGKTWELNSINQVPMYDIIFINDTTGFIGGAGGFLFKTTDSGANWNQVNLNTNRDLWSFTWSGSRLFLLLGDYATDIQLKADSFFYTDDFVNWTCRGLDTLLNSIVFVNDTVGYGTGTMLGSSWTSPGHVLRTTDKGQTWEMIFSAPNFPIYPDGFYQLAFPDINHGWIMDQYRMFYTSNGMVTSKQKLKIKELKSYPNPATNKFFIELSEKEREMDGFFIYDITSKEVSCQIETSKNKLELDISNLNSGLYIYKIINNNKIINGKFLKVNH